MSDSPVTPKHTRNPLWRVLKWLGIIVLSVALLLVAVTGLTVWILTPEKLTPLVNRYASDYLNGELKTGRVELTFWSTFPQVTVEVDDLQLISHVFDTLPSPERGVLPSYADTLLRVGNFKGGINLAKLYVGKIDLSDIVFKGVEANIVQYSPTLANYDIVPPGEEKDEEMILPGISISRFILEGETPIRYYSIPDSVDVTLRLTATDLSSHSPLYNIHVDGRGWAEQANQRWLDALPFGINGGVRWSPDTPSQIGLEDMAIGVGNLKMSLNAMMDFKDAIVLHQFDFKATSVKISDVIDIIPPFCRGELAKLTTDMEVDLTATLHGPFKPMEEQWPTVDLTLDIPSGSLTYDRLKLNTVKASIKASVKGDNPDASTVTVDNLTLIGQGVGMKIEATATRLLSDPQIKATLKGGADFSRFPKPLLDKLPFDIAGRLTADGDVNLRASYLNANKFHKIVANGAFELKGLVFAMRDSSLMATADRSTLRFGTSNSFTTATGASADSLLTGSIVVDTVAVTTPEFVMSGKNLTAGIGMRNIASSSDTTQINPIGMSIGADRVSIDMPYDTMMVRMRGIKARGSLRRYNQEGRRPLLNLAVNASAIRYRDKFNRLSLREGEINFTAHTKSRPEMSRRVSLLYDSIAEANPDLRRDSVLTMARREAVKRLRQLPDSVRTRLRQSNKADHSADIDLSVDRSVRSLLTWWEAYGTVKAKKGTLFTPYLPLRNTLSDLDMRFSTDSVVIRDTRYRIGQSDFLINGEVSNITKATTSRGNQPLKIAFDLRSDTININQISKAIFAGSAFSEKVAHGAHVAISDSDDEDEVQRSIEANANPDDKLAFVVPGNIEASLNITARDVLYADIWAHRLNGNIAVADGRVNLQRFAAFTAMGSIDLTALYTAPDLNDLSFAGGLVVRKLNLEKFLHMLPEIDSILPLLREVEGIITAEMAMTTELDSLMDLKFHTLNLAMKLSGDSLVLLDSKTFDTMAKWLMFKKKDRNMIDKMSVELAIRDSHLDLYPFMFDFDRYKLGVSGGNDFSGNYDYHIAVLKSPLPFKFGVNIKGRDDHFKFSLGKARFNENAVSSTRELTDTARINLLHEIENVFKFGVKSGRHERLMLTQPTFTRADYAVSDTLTRADSLMFIKEGVLQAPPGYLEEVKEQEEAAQALEAKKEKKKKRFLFF